MNTTDVAIWGLGKREYRVCGKCEGSEILLVLVGQKIVSTKNWDFAEDGTHAISLTASLGRNN